MRAKKLAAIGLSLALALPVFSGATAVYADDPGIYDVNKDAPNTEVTDETLTIALQALSSLIRKHGKLSLTWQPPGSGSMRPIAVLHFGTMSS